MKTTKQTNEIISKYNTLGIFPTDEELDYIARAESYFGEKVTAYQIELKLIDVAMNDTNHPYHHMVVPTEYSINL
jgi:hypothetical protein